MSHPQLRANVGAKLRPEPARYQTALDLHLARTAALRDLLFELQAEAARISDL